MKRLLTICFVAVCGLISQAASCPPKNIDPAARPAYYALEAAKRVGNIQTTAIKLNDQQQLSDADTTTIIRFTVSAERIIHDAPQGFRLALTAAIAETKKLLPPAALAKVSAVFALLEALLAQSPSAWGSCEQAGPTEGLLLVCPAGGVA